jgi:hypothetical protein
MSLFICHKCGYVENTNVVRIEEPISSEYPAYYYSTMLTRGELLCSKCNVGKWHNEFARKKPSKNDVLYSRLSKYKYITRYDHPISKKDFLKESEMTRKNMFACANLLPIVEKLTKPKRDPSISQKDRQVEAYKDKHIKIAQLRRELKVARKAKDKELIEKLILEIEEAKRIKVD